MQGSESIAWYNSPFNIQRSHAFILCQYLSQYANDPDKAILGAACIKYQYRQHLRQISIALHTKAIRGLRRNSRDLRDDKMMPMFIVSMLSRVLA